MPTVRRARPADRPAVERLLLEAGLPLDGVADAFGGYLVAEVNGDVVGAIGLERYGGYALLRSGVVAAGWRGRGLGLRLTEAALVESRRGGAQAVYLLTTTAADYFRRFGFAAIDRAEVPPAVQRSVEFQGVCPDTAVTMQLDLAGPGERSMT